MIESLSKDVLNDDLPDSSKELVDEVADAFDPRRDLTTFLTITLRFSACFLRFLFEVCVRCPVQIKKVLEKRRKKEVKRKSRKIS